MKLFNGLMTIMIALIVFAAIQTDAADNRVNLNAQNGTVSPVTNSLVPDAELYVTPSYTGPGCCWTFSLAQAFGVQLNITTVVGQVITPGATITGVTSYCGPPATSTSTTVTTTIPGGLIPSNPPPAPTCSLTVCFSSPQDSNVTIVFTGYDAAGNTPPCPPNPASGNCLLVDTVTIGAQSCLQGCVKPPANMVLWLPFNEAAGPIAYNAVGGNNGVHINSPTIINQYVKRGLCFNGANQWVDVKTYPAINFGAAPLGTNIKADFSIDAWIRREGNDAGVRTIVDKRLDSAGGIFGYHMFLFNGQLSCQLATGTFTNYSSGTVVPADGQWHFVAVTVARNNPNGITFYLDGTAVGPTGDPTPHNGSLATGARFRVGGRTASTPGSAVFLGCIDEVEVFSRVLTAAEIAQIYNAKSDGKCNQYCYLPSNVPFCINQTSKTITATICNYTGATQTYNYSFVGLPVSIGCSVNGPTVFSPASGVITIPTGTCMSFPVTVQRPAGLTCNATACYEMQISNPTGPTFYCHGSFKGSCFWCIVFPIPIIDIIKGHPTPVGPIVIGNTGQLDSMINYRIEVVDEDGNPAPDVMLNGLPPGEPVLGSLLVTAGGQGMVDLDAELDNDDPGTFYTVLFEADTDGDGIPDPIGSAGLHSYIESTPFVPGDANGDGSVDISDAVYLINYIFAGGTAPDPLDAGDANCDGSVDISDAVYLISYIFSGGPAPCAK